ncbi:MAG: thermonuclease family protein [Thaumarchaeota archaeon]|nr:thermonuclease family protein [Nitrososphaerota archaeon]
MGVIALFTSLSYANSGGDTPRLDVPKMNAPRLEMPEIDTPQIKLPLVGNVKLTNVEPKTDNKTSTCSGTALCMTDKITRIVDGDTIYTQNHKIRLALTNTPEKGKTGFSEATSFTGSICPVGSMISIDQDDKQKTDTYGRMIAKVTCSGKNLNAELLENDHASILTQYCAKSEFASESWAKKFGC